MSTDENLASSKHKYVDIKIKQDNIVEHFQQFDDWEEKYRYIINLGEMLPQFSDDDRIAENTVKGCQSTVWLKPYLLNGKVHFQSDSESAIVKGLVALLIEVFNGQTPTEIINADIFFMNEIGLKYYLSPTRSNGLLSILNKMRSEAKNFQDLFVEPI